MMGIKITLKEEYCEKCKVWTEQDLKQINISTVRTKCTTCHTDHFWEKVGYRENGGSFQEIEYDLL